MKQESPRMKTKIIALLLVFVVVLSTVVYITEVYLPQSFFGTELRPDLQRYYDSKVLEFEGETVRSKSEALTLPLSVTALPITMTLRDFTRESRPLTVVLREIIPTVLKEGLMCRSMPFRLRWSSFSSARITSAV